MVRPSLDRRWPWTGRRRPSRPGGYPLDRSDHRVLDADFAGTIYTWDIDQTYLDTHFDTLLQLAGVALELPVDKRTVPGAVPLLRGIRRGPGPTHRHTPLYFVSASPPQLRRVIERKMLLDGVDFDGIVLKDQLAWLRRGRLGRLRQHIGYKLVALLLNRRAHPRRADEILFGDDTETDAVVFAAYAATLGGALRGAALAAHLEQLGVPADEVAWVVHLADDCVATGRVRAAFVHRTAGRPARAIEAAGAPVRAVDDYLQAAAALWEMGEVDARTVREVASELRQRHRPFDAAQTLRRAAERGVLSERTVSAWVRPGAGAL